MQAIHELGIEPIFVQKSVLYKKCPLEPIFLYNAGVVQEIAFVQKMEALYKNYERLLGVVSARL